MEIGFDYQIPNNLWKKIKPLLPPLNRRKSQEDQGKMTGK
jgi:hypothetical protein